MFSYLISNSKHLVLCMLVDSAFLINFPSLSFKMFFSVWIVDYVYRTVLAITSENSSLTWRVQLLAVTLLYVTFCPKHPHF